MPATLRTETRTEAEWLAEQLVLKGRGWKAREMIIELREPVDGTRKPDDPIPVRLSSEREVERYDWWNDELYVEVLDHAKVDLSYARDGLPFCLDHWTSKQIGLVENVRVEGKELVGEVRFGSHPDAAWVRQDILEGIRKKVSIGYLQGEYEIANPKRKKGEVEIRRYAFMVMEGSSVCIPADYEVGFGRSLLRALRSTVINSPSEVRKDQETTMSGKATADAPTAGADPQERDQDEALRIRLLDGLDAMGASDTQIRTWIRDGITVKEAKEQLRKAADEEAERVKDKTAVRTAGAPDVFVRSPEGAIGRDGKPKESERTFGFDSPGEFYRAVHKAATRGVVDERIRNADKAYRAASGQSGVIDSEGGFAVPPEFMTNIIEPAYQTGEILKRVDRMGISSNSLEQNVIDETSRAKGSRFGAVTHEWGGETDSPATTSKVKLRKHRWSLSALILKGFVTDDELEDAPALGSSLTRAMQTEAQFAAEDAIVNGDGNGKPFGFLASAALVSVAIEGTQTIANTADFIAKNVAKMRARMPSGLRGNSIWLIHSDIEAKLIVATLGGTAASTPVYMGPGGLSASPYGSILGKPVIDTEYQAAEGTVGDLCYVALNQYRFVERSAGPRLQTSAHIRFWESEMAFKLRWRVDGAPLWKSAVTPAKGSNARSPFIALAARS